MLWGMRPAIWVLLIWELMSVLMVLIGVLSQGLSTMPVWWQILGWVNCVGASAVLLLLRGRTPIWFVHVALVLTAAIGIGNVAAADQLSIALNVLLIAMVLAAYVAYFLPRVQALAYVLANCAGLLVSLVIVGGQLGFPFFFPWFIVTGLSVGQVLIVGTLVRDLKRNAITDPLTGLLNRAGLDAIGLRGRRQPRMLQPRALIVIDLDDFKKVNDQRGHGEGDRILTGFADALLESTRSQDAVARVGGDEFVAVLPATDVEAATALVARLLGMVEVSCSYGATIWSDDESVTSAIKRADEAMYRHKARSKVAGD